MKFALYSSWVLVVGVPLLAISPLSGAMRRLAYVEDYYNLARPHQGISQSMPLPGGQRVRSGAVQKRQVLGGIIHDYYRAPV